MPGPTRTPAALVVTCWLSAAAIHARHRLQSDDRGEGVISAAIVVLIMAFLGAAMWAAFKLIFDDATATTREQVGRIGG